MPTKKTAKGAKPPENSVTRPAPIPAASLSRTERGEVEDKRPPRAAVLHEVIRREGEQEVRRSFSALMWSSIAAGLSMGFSMLARGLLHRHLPAFEGRFLVESVGYSMGFLIVIISRQQLFTENTMTAVLPLMSQPSARRLVALLRLWATVFLGNLIGVAVFAYGLVHLQQFDAATMRSFVDIGAELMQNTPFQMFSKGILAGWLIATMVWMLAAHGDSRASIIFVMTYLIAIGGFTHIIVGSLETLFLVFTGNLTLAEYALAFALPTLAGNIVGGSGIFALISHAQVRSDAV